MNAAPPTMFRVFEDRAERLDANGWTELGPHEWVEMPGGNYLQFNGEDAAVGRMQGIAITLLAVFVVLGVLAAMP